MFSFILDSLLLLFYYLSFFSLLLMSILFKLPHFYYWMFVQVEKNKSQLFLRGLCSQGEKEF